MRGEYGDPTTTTFGRVELPPHARRIQVETDGTIGQLGTTSACAENTAVRVYADPETGNYLRMRGEYETLLR